MSSTAETGFDQHQGRTRLETAHQVCPSSDATRGNIPVELSIA